MADTYNATVDEEVSQSSILYSGNIDLSGNLTDSHYSQAFLISEANKGEAGFFAEASGGGGTNGDVDVRLEVSNTPDDDASWVDAGQLVDLDADATARTGSALLGDSATEEFHAFKWGRIHADGLASNDETDVDWTLNGQKRSGVGITNGTKVTDTATP